MNITADTERRSLNVAIVGGGVVGLTCAVALLRADVHVELFEAAVGLSDLHLLDIHECILNRHDLKRSGQE